MYDPGLTILQSGVMEVTLCLNFEKDEFFS